MVEFMLFLPILLVLVFAVIEFGVILTNQVSLVHAAEDAARAGASPGCNLDTSCEQSAASAQATTAPPSLSQCSNLSTTPATSGGNPQQITVTMTCRYNAFTPLGSVIQLIGGTFNNGKSLTLHAATTMRVEQ